MTELSERSLDELADGICLRAGRIAAAEAELLPWIAEFDRREGWAGTGLLSCAHWLSWRIGLSPGAARERVRVARRLEELPAIAAAHAEGRMSWSQIRAVTRVAEPDDGHDWVELARSTSAAGIEKLVRGLRRAQRIQEDALDPEAVAARLSLRTRYDHDGNLTITIKASAEEGAVILAGIEAQRGELERSRAESSPTETVAVEDVPPETPQAEDVPAGTPIAVAAHSAPDDDEQADGWPTGTTRGQVRELVAKWAPPKAPDTPPDELSAAEDVPHDDVPAGTPSVPPEPPRVSEAQALLAMARAALDSQHAQHPDAARRTRGRLVTQIDPLSGWARLRDGELLPPSRLKAVLKSLPGRDKATRLRPLTPADLKRFDLGRRQHEVSPALRQLLGTIDGERCRFPGCTRHMKLHAHHVVFWSQGGPTDMANLALVCSRHHTLIHAQGFQLVLHPDRRLTVTTADGVPVLHLPRLPWGDPAELDPTGRVSAGTLPPDRYDRMDLDYVVSVLMQQAA